MKTGGRHTTTLCRDGLRLPVRVQRDAKGRLCAFTWREVTYHVRVIGSWCLATRWWDFQYKADRTYYCVETPDHQIFELHRDVAQGDVWVFDVCQDWGQRATRRVLARP